jgi:RNA polymerase sigma-70 factor, ECF subfamily
VDHANIRAAQAGDSDAYAHLVRERAGHLYAIAQRVLRDPHLAEDAVQNALVLAWRDLPRLRDPDRLDAWLHRLVVNACVSEARRRRRIVAHLVELPVDIEVGHDAYLDVAERDALDRAFLRLTAAQRVVVVLRHYGGYETATIADMLGVPHGTVRSRLHHAHQQMRAALDADSRPQVAGGASA